MSGGAPAAFAAVVTRELRHGERRLMRLERTSAEQAQALAETGAQLSERLTALARQTAAADGDRAARIEALDRSLHGVAELLARAAEQIAELRTRPDVPATVVEQLQAGAVAVAELARRVIELEQRPDPAAGVQRALDALRARVEAWPAPPDTAALRKSLRASLRTDLGTLAATLRAELSPAKAAAGANGWSPLLRLVNKGTRSLLELYDWTGGHGDKPRTGWLGPTGIVEHDREATDIRGAPGVAYGGGGGIDEPRVVELIEQAMAQDSGEQDYQHQTATLTTAGDTTVLTPPPGQALRVHWVYAVGDPDNADAPLITVRLGARELYRAYALSKRQQITGAADEALVVNLSAAASVAVTVIYEVITP